MYDVIIIGGGPAGYLAAERLGHHGKSVLLVEKALLGGVCLNVGCIPTKTLLNSAKHYVHALECGKFGVSAENVRYDWSAMQSWKGEVVDKLRAGIATQMKRFKVEVIDGTAELQSPGHVKVTPSAGQDRGEARIEDCRAVLIATGSSPAMPPVPGARDNPLVVDSTGLLATTFVPKRLCVIGGGVIGVEFASLFSSLGSEVTIVEMLDEIVPFMDSEQAPILRRALRSIKWKLGCKVESIAGGTVHYSTKNGTKETVEADMILVAVGRRPNIQGLGAEKAGLDAGPKGVVVDEHMRTNLPGVWAAGDITGKSLLAHSAYRMAEVAVSDIIASQDGGGRGKERMRYDAIPWAVYSIPEAAGVGMTEQDAASRGIAIKKSQIPLRVSGRFAAENGFAAQGAVKLIAEAATGRILGLHAVGSYASEAIWGGAALIEQEFRVEDVRALVFPHPTVYELIRDAAWEIQ